MNEMVTISRAEYEHLRQAEEELAAIAAFERVTADLAAGREEMIPDPFATRLINRENALRVYRDFRGLTQEALAQASGVNRVQIADIEAGRKTGSVATLRKLADALKLTIDDLV
jgi:DNA-binding XRE family transcriptional regulator